MKDYLNRFGVQVVRLKPTDEAMTVHAFVKGMLSGPFSESLLRFYPKGITNHSYSPNLVLKAVFHSSPSSILIWWYPLLRSILENIVDPSNSSSLGIECLYLMVMLLMTLQLQHILHLPSFLGTNKTDTTQGLRLFWTQPFSNNSWNCDSISLVSSGLVL